MLGLITRLAVPIHTVYGLDPKWQCVREPVFWAQQYLELYLASKFLTSFYYHYCTKICLWTHLVHWINGETLAKMILSMVNRSLQCRHFASDHLERPEVASEWEYNASLLFVHFSYKMFLVRFALVYYHEERFLNTCYPFNGQCKKWF